MNNKRTLIKKIINIKDIVLVTSVHIFFTALFTKNNIKVVIQMHTFQMDQFLSDLKSTFFGNSC